MEPTISQGCACGHQTEKPTQILSDEHRVYCVCSLEPEEAEDQIAALLARDPRVTRTPVAAQEVAGHAEFLAAKGDLRTLPPQLPDPDPRWGGLDGFYAARLTRTA